MDSAQQEPGRSQGPLVVVMGVSGSGKSTVGELVAGLLGTPFIDGDSLHSPENLAKMSAGVPLDDADRRPWLSDIGRTLRAHEHSGLVVACSSLRRIYRRIILWEEPRVFFIHLSGSRELIAARLATRSGHFMPSALLDSQFDLLEPLDVDEHGMTIPIDGMPEEIVVRATSRIRDETANTAR
ncbi:gluconokinase [Luethyella okanaganae]|uniref:Gluconokinase n=1 Tax=Luethyella okanaganae TaxID=69372 RepID=A0ABW1VCU3_9MICO